MNTGFSDIVAAALTLSDADRAALAYQMLDSLREPHGLGEDDERYFAELERRSAAYLDGSSVPSDLSDVEKRMRQSLRERRPS